MSEKPTYRLEQIEGAPRGEDWALVRDGRRVLVGPRGECAAALRDLNLWAASEAAKGAAA